MIITEMTTKYSLYWIDNNYVPGAMDKVANERQFPTLWQLTQLWRKRCYHGNSSATKSSDSRNTRPSIPEGWGESQKASLRKKY